MSFHDMPNPTGGMPVERVIDRPTPEEHLLERILATENMDLAWKRVRAHLASMVLPSTRSPNGSGPSGAISVHRLQQVRTNHSRSFEWKYPNQRAAPARWGFPPSLTG